MSSLFQTATVGDESSSEGKKPVGFSAIERRDDSGPRALTVQKQRRELLLPFNVTLAKSKPDIPVVVGDNKKVSREKFAELTQNLLDHAGLGKELEERKWAYVRGVFLAHVVNSASILVPARADIRIDGYDTVWNYARDVIHVLGPLPREYFRTAADEIVLEVQKLFDGRATASQGELEMIASIEQRAMERGLFRTPWFAFDAAEGVTSAVATTADRYAILGAKSRKLAELVNPVDSMVGEEDMVREVSKPAAAAPRDRGGALPY